MRELPDVFRRRHVPGINHVQSDGHLQRNGYVRVVEYMLWLTHVRRSAHVPHCDLRRRGHLCRRDDLRRQHNMFAQPDLSLHGDVFRVYHLRR